MQSSEVFQISQVCRDNDNIRVELVYFWLSFILQIVVTFRFLVGYTLVENARNGLYSFCANV